MNRIHLAIILIATIVTVYLWTFTKRNISLLFEKTTSSYKVDFSASDKSVSNTVSVLPGRGHDPIKIAHISRNPFESEQRILYKSFWSDINDQQDGIGGRHIALSVYDSGGTAYGARESAKKAITDGAVLLLGPVQNSEALAVAKIANFFKVPMICALATHPGITNNHPFVFRNCPSDSLQGAALADFAKQKYWQKAAVAVNVSGIYSSALNHIFRQAFQKQGGSIIKSVDYLAEVTDFNSLAHELTSKSPDFVFLPTYLEDASAIVKAIHGIDKKIPILGGEGWNGNVKAKSVDFKNCFHTFFWRPSMRILDNGTNKRPKNFPPREEISTDLALVVDAALLALQALKSSGDCSPLNIQEALAAIHRPNSYTNNYVLDHHGNAIRPFGFASYDKYGQEKILDTFTPKTFIVGAIFAKTGEAAPVTRMVFDALRFAADEINSDGGILGNQVVVFEYDNQSTALGSRKAALQAVSEGVSAVIGSSWSSHSIAAAKVLQEVRIPMISPASSSLEFTEIGDCIYRICFVDRSQGEAMAYFAAAQLSARTAGLLINSNSEYSIELAEYFRKGFAQRGGKITFSADYLQDETDFRALLAPLVKQQPDVVFLPGYPRDSAFIMKQARQMGIKSVFLGGDGWNKKMYEYGGNAINGAYYTENWHPDIDIPASRELVHSFSSSCYFPDCGLIALARDALYAVKAACEKAGGVKLQDIIRGLPQVTDLQGATGTIDFSKGRNPKKDVAILQFLDNDIRLNCIVKASEIKDE